MAQEKNKEKSGKKNIKTNNSRKKQEDFIDISENDENFNDNFDDFSIGFDDFANNFENEFSDDEFEDESDLTLDDADSDFHNDLLEEEDIEPNDALNFDDFEDKKKSSN